MNFFGWINKKSGTLYGVTSPLSQSHEATDSLFPQTSPASHPVRAHNSFRVWFPLLDTQCGWLLTIHHHDFKGRKVCSCGMCRYSWSLNSIVLNPRENRGTLAILNKSDQVMSGFKERSATDCTIVYNFQYILLSKHEMLIINCLLF